MTAKPSIRIGIFGSYGGLNLGDEAILHSMLRQIRESVEAELTVFTRDVEDTERRHGVRGLAPANLSRDEARAEIQKLDLLILGGGGILYDRDAELYLREVKLAHEVGVPVAVYAISAGPLKKQAMRDLVRDALGPVALITVRDKRARQLLEEIGIEKEITVTADPALLLEPEPLPEGAFEAEGLPTDVPIVGFSVREPGPAAPDIDVDHYHSLIANAADYMVSRLNAYIVFVPMERRKMDMQQSHAVVSLMKNADRATVLKGDYSAGQLLALVGRMKLAVGMRLHFLIFAALQRVPFVPLPYATKVAGFIEEMGMEMPPLHDVNAGVLIAAIDRSWDYRKTLEKRIDEHLPRMQESARTTHRLLLDLIDRIEPEARKEA
ncbi:MAG TPA: polysaccharide pyruvyl transferase family protein [Thermoanaerobaculia bacterium]|nr:polysaccharide pyruvyl transferase family protein [Thermoanaerobaculia bacterium]